MFRNDFDSMNIFLFKKKIVGKNFEINGENKFFKNGWRVFFFLSNDLWVGLRFCNQITMLTKSIRDIN